MATRNTLTVVQRNKIADKLMMLGNIVFSAMVIAPIVSQELRGAGVIVAGSGILTFQVMYFGAVWIMKGGAKH